MSLLTPIKKILKPILPRSVVKAYRKMVQPFRLSGYGERVVINLNTLPAFDSLNVYQKSHLRRYEFAATKVQPGDTCGDFACGTGYGTVMLAQKSKKAIGVDIDKQVIAQIQKDYAKVPNVSFVAKNLLTLEYKNTFDVVVSFETIEHFKESDIPTLFKLYFDGLQNNGLCIFSTPYMQEASEETLDHGFHLTFNINEQKISQWLAGAGFSDITFLYQNYETHDIVPNIPQKDFIIGMARKRV